MAAFNKSAACGCVMRSFAIAIWPQIGFNCHKTCDNARSPLNIFLAVAENQPIKNRVKTNLSFSDFSEKLRDFVRASEQRAADILSA